MAVHSCDDGDAAVEGNGIELRSAATKVHADAVNPHFDPSHELAVLDCHRALTRDPS